MRIDFPGTNPLNASPRAVDEARRDVILPACGWVFPSLANELYVKRVDWGLWRSDAEFHPESVCAEAEPDRRRLRQRRAATGAGARVGRRVCAFLRGEHGRALARQERSERAAGV